MDFRLVSADPFASYHVLKTGFSVAERKISKAILSLFIKLLATAFCVLMLSCSF